MQCGVLYCMCVLMPIYVRAYHVCIYIRVSVRCPYMAVKTADEDEEVEMDIEEPVKEEPKHQKKIKAEKKIKVLNVPTFGVCTHTIHEYWL